MCQALFAEGRRAVYGVAHRQYCGDAAIGVTLGTLIFLAASRYLDAAGSSRAAGCAVMGSLICWAAMWRLSALIPLCSG